MNSIRFRTFLLGLLVCMMLSQISLGQTKRMVSLPRADALTKEILVATTPVYEASVTPVIFDGMNVNCADLNASADSRFSHITSNNELKLDFGDPNGTFPFTTGDGRQVVGTQVPGASVTITSGSATVNSWSSQLQISAVVVKVGNTSYVYPYNPLAYSDTNLATGDNRGISHVSFCFVLRPTAASTSIGGRTLSSYGRAISSAFVSVMDAETGKTTSVYTNTFGYYKVQNLEVGRLYVVTVSHRRYSFSEPSKVVNLMEQLTDMNFIANGY